jgi:single-strand DNA-binding protein
MSDINNITIVGRLTKDPDIKYTEAGSALCIINIANNRRYKEKEDVSYIECISFGKGAEIAGQYLKKGSKVGISGVLKENRWEDKEGKKRSSMQIIVSEFQFLDNKKETV